MQVGVLALSVRLPQDYPSTSTAQFTVQSLHEVDIEARGQLVTAVGDAWFPSTVQKGEVLAVLAEATVSWAGFNRVRWS